MKVLNRKEFMKMPPGTFFCKGEEWYFDGFSIKGDSIGDDDFYSVELCFIEFSSSEEMVDLLEDSLKNGSSYSINESESRDGMFDDSDLFLVYEGKDLEILSSLINTAKEVCNSNDN